MEDTEGEMYPCIRLLRLYVTETDNSDGVMSCLSPALKDGTRLRRRRLNRIFNFVVKCIGETETPSDWACSSI